MVLSPLLATTFASVFVLAGALMLLRKKLLNGLWVLGVWGTNIAGFVLAWLAVYIYFFTEVGNREAPYVFFSVLFALAATVFLATALLKSADIKFQAGPAVKRLWLGLLLAPPLPAIVLVGVSYFQRDEWAVLFGILGLAASYVSCVPALLLVVLFLRRFGTLSFWRIVLLTPIALLLIVIPVFNPLSAISKLSDGLAIMDGLILGLTAGAVFCWVTGIGPIRRQRTGAI